MKSVSKRRRRESMDNQYRYHDKHELLNAASVAARRGAERRERGGPQGRGAQRRGPLIPRRKSLRIRAFLSLTGQSAEGSNMKLFGHWRMVEPPACGWLDDGPSWPELGAAPHGCGSRRHSSLPDNRRATSPPAGRPGPTSPAARSMPRPRSAWSAFTVKRRYVYHCD